MDELKMGEASATDTDTILIRTSSGPPVLAFWESTEQNAPTIQIAADGTHKLGADTTLEQALALIHRRVSELAVRSSSTESDK